MPSSYYAHSIKCMKRINEPLICSSIEHFGVYGMVRYCMESAALESRKRERKEKRHCRLAVSSLDLYLVLLLGALHTFCLRGSLHIVGLLLVQLSSSPKLLFCFFCSCCLSCMCTFTKKCVVKVNLGAIHIWAVVDGTKELFYLLTTH